MAVMTLNPTDVLFIAVHCSATPPTNNATAADIDRWHRLRGFVGIGYHFVIRRDGTVESGRPLNQRGAHIENFNHCSVGVCLVGGVDATKLMKPENNFTPKQFAALRSKLAELKVLFPQAVVQGHRDFPNVSKACPSFDVAGWQRRTPA